MNTALLFLVNKPVAVSQSSATGSAVTGSVARSANAVFMVFVNCMRLRMRLVATQSPPHFSCDLGSNLEQFYEMTKIPDKKTLTRTTVASLLAPSIWSQRATPLLFRRRSLFLSQSGSGVLCFLTLSPTSSRVNIGSDSSPKSWFVF